MPGRLLLKLASMIFEEPALSTVVSPVLADLQQEVHEAGASPLRRIAARARGYVAFWKLLAVCLVEMPVFSVRRAPVTTIVPARTGGSLPVVLSLALYAALWSMFGWFVAATIIGGVVMAFALRYWNTRHPSTVVSENCLAISPDARINMSSIPVAGDIGGLFFVIGAVAIVLLGLPDVRWFVLASTIVAGVLAVTVFAWRSRQAATTFTSVYQR